MRLTKAQQDERDAAIRKLREILKPGMTLTTVIRHVSRSGMLRAISVAIPSSDGDGVDNLDYYISRALGRPCDANFGGIKCHGGGMDMGNELVYRLGCVLWPDGTPEPHGKRNGQPDSAGGYALKHRWL